MDGPGTLTGLKSGLFEPDQRHQVHARTTFMPSRSANHAELTIAVQGDISTQ